MTAVASLTHVWVMVDNKLPTQLQRSPELNISPALIFQSVSLTQ